MDGEVERYMEVLERPPKLQPSYRSAFFTSHSRTTTPILLKKSPHLI